MPAFLLRLAMWFMASFASSFILKILLGAGLAVFTYSKVDDLISAAQNQMQGLYGNLPADVLGVLGILKIPQSISVIMSAMGIAAFIKMSKVFIGKAD
ncbi:DUF2523 domain-containing protein [Acinetobacter guillouiae]